MKTLSLLVLGAAACIGTARAQSYTQVQEVVASGAMDVSNNVMHLRATIGQPVVGPTLNATDVAEQGFWHPESESASSVEITQTGLPAGFMLDQNYPNPFDPATTIRFALPGNAHVALRIYTLTGALVQTLVDDKLTAGAYSVRFDGAALSAGAYLYSLETGGQEITKEMTVIR